MAIFQITQTPLPEENNEFNFRNLYLFHTHKGPNRNQFAVTSNDSATGLGQIAVNNWEIYDGVGESTKIVARAQGMHTNAGNWANVFCIVFEDESYRGSTLQVMGISVDENGEFAIVGGTGKFAMATGVISKKLNKRTNDGTIVQLTIHGFSPVLKGWSPPARPVKKIEPLLGGDGGVLQDITEAPRRLESITVQHGVVIDSIAFSYVDQAGQKRTAGPWGGSGRKSETIQLGPSEFVKGVSGTVGLYRSCKVIASLTFVTNLKTYETLGLGDGTPFTIPVEDNQSVVGFFARSKTYLDAIGVYVQPR